MRKIPKPYQMPFFAAVVLHLFLFIFLLMEMPHSVNNGTNALFNAPKIIQAKAVSEDPIAVQKAYERALAARRALAHQKAQAKKRAIARKKAEAKRKAQAIATALAAKKALAIKKAKERALLAKQNALQQKWQAEQLKKAQQQLAKARQQAMQGVIDRYLSQVKAAIQQNWHQPFQKATLVSIYEVNLAPGGVVLSVNLIKSSGNSLLDQSGRLAILKSSPLPVPKDPVLFDQFRHFTIKMSPKGAV